MKKLYVDKGHQGVGKGLDPGAVGNGLYEANIVNDIGDRVIKYLNDNYTEILIKTNRNGDNAKNNTARVKEANDFGADYYFALHVNSAGGTNGTGYEDFIHDKLSDSSNTAKMRDKVHAEILPVLKKYGIKNRGKKKANFQVIRETKMSAILVETLFINNPSDAKLLKNSAFIQDISVAYAKGIAVAMGLKSKPKTTPKPTPKTGLFKVQCGAFSSESNAKKLAERLKKDGYPVYIVKE